MVPLLILIQFIITTQSKTITCSGTECDNQAIDCEGDDVCTITCTTINSCNTTTIITNGVASLTVNCIKDLTCENLVINGDDIDNVNLNCAAFASCQEATLSFEESDVMWLCGISACDVDVTLTAVDSNIVLQCIEKGCDENFIINIEESTLSIPQCGVGACDDNFIINAVDSTVNMVCDGVGACDNVFNINAQDSKISLACSGMDACINNVNIDVSRGNELHIDATGSNSLSGAVIVCPTKEFDSDKCVIHIGEHANINGATIYSWGGFASMELDCNSDPCFEDPTYPTLICGSQNQCQFENTSPTWDEWQCIEGGAITCPLDDDAESGTGESESSESSDSNDNFNALYSNNEMDNNNVDDNNGSYSITVTFGRSTLINIGFMIGVLMCALMVVLHLCCKNQK